MTHLIISHTWCFADCMNLTQTARGDSVCEHLHSHLPVFVSVCVFVVCACASNLDNITVTVVKLALFMQPRAQLNVMQTGCNSATSKLSLTSFTPGNNICIWIRYLDNDILPQVFAFHPWVSVLLISFFFFPSLCLAYNVRKKVGGTIGDSKLTCCVPNRQSEAMLLNALFVFLPC